MKITPMDIQQQQFRTAFRGFDIQEVDAFLDLVRQEFETLIARKHDLEELVRQRDGELTAFREREQTLKETLVTAQRMTEEIVSGARKEAEIITAQAELGGEKLLMAAQGRLRQLLEEIADLKRMKATFAAEVRAQIESHLRLLELQVEEEQRERQIEETVRVIKSRDSALEKPQPISIGKKAES